MNFRKSLLLGSSALAINAALTGAIMLKPEPALAACQVVSGADATISSAISCITWDSNNVTITGPGTGTVTGSNTAILNSGNSVGSLTNSGIVNGTNIGVFNNAGIMGNILNNGSIVSSSAGIVNLGGTVGTITNNDTISGPGSGGIITTGSIAAIINNIGGVIVGDAGVANAGGSIGSIDNSGSIGGTLYGIFNHTGTIGTISNSGTISGDVGPGTYGINNGGSIGTITNSIGGTISGDLAINNSGHISTVDNNNIISGSLVGISNNGTIGILTNNGTISGFYGIENFSSIGTLINSIGSSIGGNVDGLLAGGTIGLVSNSGTIKSNGFGYGIVVNGSGIGTITNDSTGLISGTSLDGIANASSIGVITNSGIINGATAGISSSGTISTISNTGTIISAGIGIYNIGSIDTISNSSIISGATAIDNTGTIFSVISNTGTLSGTIIGINNNNGSIAAIINSIAGSIIGTNTGIKNSGSIGALSNDGSIGGGSIGVENNAGSISTIGNSGIISGTLGGIGNTSGTIDTITNSGSIGGMFGIANISGSIGTITNSDIIAGTYGILNNGGSIAVINNTATISGGSSFAAGGITNSGSIGTITNSGTIAGSLNGIVNFGGIIDTIINSGTISSSISVSSSSAALANTGTIGTITNSGLISGPNAINSTGTILSAITNTGTIEGNINVAQDLTITGGNASTIGTLTGFSTIAGTITANNLTFDSAAYQLLNDEINVGAGAGTVTNSGTLMINAAHTITGSYLQDPSALLVIGVTDPTHYGNLVITGDAIMTNTRVSITPISGTLTGGETFTIVYDTITGTTDYSGVTATVSGFTASVSSIISGGFDDLIIGLSGGGGGSCNYGSIGSDAGGRVAPPTGTALCQVQAGGNPAFNYIFTALDNLGSISQAAEQQGIKELAPNQLPPQVIQTGQLATKTVQAVMQHQDGLLTAATGNGLVGRAGGSPYQEGVFWGQVSGGSTLRDTTGDTGGYRNDFYQFTFGADDHLSAHTTAGVAFSWVRSYATGHGDLSGQTLSADNFQITGYGTRRFGPGFVDGMIGIGYNRFDEQRDISFLGQTAQANYGGMQYVAKIEAGRDFTGKIYIPKKLNPAAPFSFTQTVTLTPLAGFQALRVDTNSYTESGAGAANLSVNEQTTNSFATTLGGRASTLMPTAWGDLVPEIKVMWVHDLGQQFIPTTATLGGVSFTTGAPRPAMDGAQITLAVTLKEGDDLSVRLEYIGDLRADYSSHAGLIKVEGKF